MNSFINKLNKIQVSVFSTVILLVCLVSITPANASTAKTLNILPVNVNTIHVISSSKVIDITPAFTSSISPLSILNINTNYTYAIGNSNAINDIIDNPRFQGSLEALSTVTQVLDSWFAFFISLIAFFIISTAMLRNVVAGGYASYPIFFDKVHDAKMAAMEAARGLGSKNAKLRGMGSFMCWLIGWFPDFKELSEFREETVRPKDYFIKAIPQMIGVIMIGVVIYNGYYRDVVVKTAGLGSEIIERTLTAIDPVEALNKVINSVGNPVLATEDDDSDVGKFTYSLSKELYHQVISFYSDIKSLSQKTELSTKVEGWISNNLKADATSYMDEKQWDRKFKIDKVIGQPDLSTVVREESGDSEQVIKAWSIPVSQLGLDTALHKGEDWYYRLIVVFTKVHSGTSSVGAATDLVMHVPISSNWIYSDGKTTIDLGSHSDMFYISSSAKVNGSSVYSNGSVISVGSELPKGDKIPVTGWSYNANGATNKIAYIQADSSESEIYFSSSKVSNFKAGETPQTTVSNDAKAKGETKK